MRAILSAFESAIHDVRYGARLLRRSPWFTAVGIASLAIGLGSGVGLFTVMNGMLFRPLAGRGTADLHAIHTSNRDGGRYGGSSYLDFQSFLGAAPDLFAGACASTNARGNLAVGAAVHPLAGAVVSTGCFEALRVRPHLGRLLNRSDDAPDGGPAGVVISYALWRRAFAGDSAAVGRGTLLNGASVAIVGVAEPGFAGVSFDSGADFWVPPHVAPVLLSPGVLTSRGERRFRVFARFREGVTAPQVSARLAAVAAQLRAEDPRAWTDTTGSTRTVTVTRELESRFVDSRGAAGFIATTTLGAIAAIVAMACVNLATMIVARGAARTRELSLRIALGASRGRLLRQLATESLLISAAGGAAGLAIVATALRIYDARRPAEIPAFDLTLDWRVVGFAILTATLTPLLFGVAPGVHALRIATAEGLKGRPVGLRRRFLRAGSRELLIVAQVVASFALLIMATLFMRSLAFGESGQRESPARSITVLPVSLNTATGSGAERLAITERLLQAVDRVPDVSGATAAGVVPMTGSFIGFSGRPDGSPAGTSISFDANMVAPGYFELVGTAVRAGRGFDARDHPRAPRVAVVSESLARSLWQTPVAVGRRIHVGDGSLEIVGVVADVPYRSLSDTSHPVVYLPLAQSPRERLVLHARVRRDGDGIGALTRAVQGVDPRIVADAAMPLSRFLDRARAPARLAQWIGAAAGLLQLGLALMATWGLVAYAVERRTVEIAIRRALGATEASILRLVMRPSLWLVGVGAAAGCAAGAIGAKLLHATFIGLAPLDLMAVLPAAGLLAAVVVTAAWLPARRAISIEPASALKES